MVAYVESAIEGLSCKLHRAIVDFYLLSYWYYLATGHDLLEAPYKQEELMKRVNNPEVRRSLISERKYCVAILETAIAGNLAELDLLGIAMNEAPLPSCQIKFEREDALRKARQECDYLLEQNNGRFQLKHLPLELLSRRGLYFRI